MKEAIFFTYGDSSRTSTWSNVPYFFSKGLESKGVRLWRVDISPNSVIASIYNRTIWRLFSLFYPGNFYSFERTKLARLRVKRLINKAVKKHRDADMCIFLTYDYCAKEFGMPSLVLSDWTAKILVERQERIPYWFERRYLQYEEKIIRAADYVISLFPDCAERMKLDYPEAHIYSFNTNVVNSLYDDPLCENDIVKKKEKRKKILFIGGSKYKQSLMLLISAFQRLKDKDEELELHVVGMTEKEVGRWFEGIIYHGYLRKDINDEKARYYHLLMTASVIVNVSPMWGGYSSIIEAMFFYTPVIVSPFREFVSEFGNDISFGIYLHEYTVDCLEQTLKDLLLSEDYRQMCHSAHNVVQDYTWPSYVDSVIQLVDSKQCS